MAKRFRVNQKTMAKCRRCFRPSVTQPAAAGEVAGRPASGFDGLSHAVDLRFGVPDGFEHVDRHTVEGSVLFGRASGCG